MTKLELLKLLEGVPDDAIMVVNGHSDGSGFENITNVDAFQVIEKESDWEGEYLPYDFYPEHYDREGKIPMTALIHTMMRLRFSKMKVKPSLQLHC